MKHIRSRKAVVPVIAIALVGCCCAPGIAQEQRAAQRPAGGGDGDTVTPRAPGKPPLLEDAIRRANRLILQKGKWQKSEVMSCFEDVLAVRAAVVKTQRLPDNTLCVHGTVLVERPTLKFQTSAARNAEIAAAEKKVGELERKADDALREFDADWVRGTVRVRGGQVMPVWRNAAYPRKMHLSDAEHARLRNDIVDRGHKDVGAARRELEQLRETQRRERTAAQEAARTVRVVINVSAEALNDVDLQRVQAAGRISIRGKVEDFQSEHDPQELVGGGEHVTSLEVTAVRRNNED